MSQSNPQIGENKMGYMPVGKLLITMAAPMMLSMLVQALYNVVDSIYIGHYDVNALSGVSLAFSLQNMMIAIVTGTAVGVNALLSRALGERKRDEASNIAMHGVMLAFVGFAVIFVAVLCCTDIYFNGLIGTAEITEAFNPSEVIAYGKSYVYVCCLCSLPLFLQITFERLMQATGRTVYTMITQGVGAIINIILDPIFIFTFDLGAMGAAIATVLGQAVAAILAILFNKFKNPDIALSIHSFRPSWRTVRKIYAIGVPSIVVVGIGSIMYYCVSGIVAGIKGIGATVFGTYYKLQSFFFMPVFGLNNGLIPIVAYNYGARNRSRMNAALKWAIIIGAGIMIVGTLAMNLFPEQLLLIFEKDAANPVMLADGIPALRIISLSFPVAAVCIVYGSLFQALGHGLLSAIVSFARQMIVLVPAVLLLAQTGVLENVWWAWPISEIMSLIATVIGFVYLYQKLIRHIPLGKINPAELH